MKTWHKAVIVVVCGGLAWGLAYMSSMFPEYALVTSSFSAGITGLCGILTGFPKSE
jgi:hypothetical protein